MSPERIAPERFGFKNSRPTISSDCYALGMVIYETISGNFPFHKDTDLTVSMKVVEGKRPPRGVKFTDDLWGTLEKCWTPKPDNRPGVEEVLRCLEIAPDLSEPPSFGTDEGTDEESDDRESLSGSSDGDSGDFPTTDNRVQPPPADSLQDASTSPSTGTVRRGPVSVERTPTSRSAHTVSPYSHHPLASVTPPDHPPPKKGKRANAEQLRALNKVYARTAFPSTEERQDLALRLGLTPRNVQIWYASYLLHHRPHLIFPLGSKTNDR